MWCMVCVHGVCVLVWLFVFFFQAEDGIRDAQESRGLGDVYKRQVVVTQNIDGLHQRAGSSHVIELHGTMHSFRCVEAVSYTHLTLPTIYSV